MRVCVTLVLTCWLLPVCACTEPVLVGYECPEGQEPCGPTSSRPPKRDAGKSDADAEAEDSGPEVDADAMDAEADAAMDASTIDAGPDGDRFEYLLQNPSFEITEGDAGAIFGPLGGSAHIAPWMRCLELSGVLEGIDVTGDVMDGALLPTDGESFLVFSLVVTPGVATLTQELTRTWKAGETRAITVDVTAAGLGFDSVRLVALGSASMCPLVNGEREMLAVGDSIGQSSMWAEVCLEMTPTRDTNWLMLTADPAGISLDAASRLFLDNLREGDRCPEPDAGPDPEADPEPDSGAAPEPGAGADTEPAP